MLKIMPKYTNDKKARLSNIQKQVLKSNTFVSEVKTKTLNIIIGNFLFGEIILQKIYIPYLNKHS